MVETNLNSLVIKEEGICRARKTASEFRKRNLLTRSKTPKVESSKVLV